MSEPICPINMQPEVLSAWRSRLLSTNEMVRINTHVPDCSACQAALARFDRIAEAVRISPHMPSGEEIWRKMQQRMIQRSLRPPQQRQLFLAGGLGAAALVVLIAALVLALMGKGTPTTSQPQPTVLPSTTANVAPTATGTAPATATKAPTTTAAASNRPYIYFNAGPSGKILAINPVNDQIVWHQDNNHGGGYTQPFVVNGSVYAAFYATTPVHQGSVFSFNAQTGTLRWQTLVNGNYTLFAEENGVVFAVSVDSFIALRMSDGHILWTYTLAAPLTDLIYSEQDGVVGYYGLAIDGKSVQVAALDSKTGIQKWSVSFANVQFAPGLETLAVGSGVVYIYTYQSVGSVRALAGADGHQLWSITPGPSQTIDRLGYGDGVVFAVSADGTLIAYDAQSGAKKWSIPTNGSETGVPIVVNGIAYVAGGGISVDGNYAGSGVYAINVATGTLLWQQGIGTPFVGLPVVSDGWLYASVATTNGLIQAFDINTDALVWTYSDGFGLLGVEP
jgi:outer membrane protein assembly factor BamB